MMIRLVSRPFGWEQLDALGDRSRHTWVSVSNLFGVVTRPATPRLLVEPDRVHYAEALHTRESYASI